MISHEEQVIAGQYELVIRKAFDDCDESKHRAKAVYMRSLIMTERGENAGKHLGSYEKQLKEIKNNISKAIKKLSTNKLYSDYGDFLNLANQRLQSCQTTSDLGQVLHSILEMINQKQ